MFAPMSRQAAASQQQTPLKRNNQKQKSLILKISNPK